MRMRFVCVVACLFAIACTPAATAPTPTPSEPPASSPGPTDPQATPLQPTATPGASASATPVPSSTEPPVGPIDHPTGGDELVLRITVDGGLAGPDHNSRTIPPFSLYGDGSVISEGVQILIFPGPALPALQMSRISLEGIQRVLAGAAEVGLLGPDRHYDLQGIFDAPTTTFTINANGAAHTISAYALGMEQGLGDVLDPEELRARQQMTLYQSAFSDLRSWLGTDVVADGLPFAFDEIRIFAIPSQPLEELPEVPQIMQWPLAGTFGEFGEPYPMGEGARCGTVSGDDLADLVPALQQANQLTRWTSDGEDLYELVLRPLLPDESGCPSALPQ